MPRISMVEDDVVLGKSIRLTLTQAGYEVHLATNLRGAELLDRTLDSHISHLRAKLKELAGERVEVVAVPFGRFGKRHPVDDCPTSWRIGVRAELEARR